MSPRCLFCEMCHEDKTGSRGRGSTTMGPWLAPPMLHPADYLPCRSQIAGDKRKAVERREKKKKSKAKRRDIHVCISGPRFKAEVPAWSRRGGTASSSNSAFSVGGHGKARRSLGERGPASVRARDRSFGSGDFMRRTHEQHQETQTCFPAPLPPSGLAK